MRLTPEEAQRYLIALGRYYEAVCDEPGCGKLLAAGSLYSVVKWAKREGGLTQLLGRVPKKVRCLECNDKKLGINREKIAEKKEQKVNIIPDVRKGVLRVFRKDNTPLTDDELILRLRRKSQLREFKKGEMKRTFRAMKKRKVLKRKEGKWFLPPERKNKK